MLSAYSEVNGLAIWFLLPRSLNNLTQWSSEMRLETMTPTSKGWWQVKSNQENVNCLGHYKSIQGDEFKTIQKSVVLFSHKIIEKSPKPAVVGRSRKYSPSGRQSLSLCPIISFSGFFSHGQFLLFLLWVRKLKLGVLSAPPKGTHPARKGSASELRSARILNSTRPDSSFLWKTTSRKSHHWDSVSVRPVGTKWRVWWHLMWQQLWCQMTCSGLNMEFTCTLIFIILIWKIVIINTNNNEIIIKSTLKGCHSDYKNDHL